MTAGGARSLPDAQITVGDASSLLEDLITTRGMPRVREGGTKSLLELIRAVKVKKKMKVLVIPDHGSLLHKLKNWFPLVKL